jgi:glycosyltransferase involved in cell wall biosynthesis
LPGIAVLHEFMLHHLARGVTLDADDSAGYVEEMRYCAGESGRGAAQRLLDTHRPIDLWAFPLFERIVDQSLATMVHSEFARRRIRASRAGARVDVVPFPVSGARRLEEIERARARRELGLDADAFVLASFGLVTPQKRLDPALTAFARFRRDHPEAHFLVCGEVSVHYDLEARIAALGGEGVLVTGRLDPTAYRSAMAACDVAVNLRHPTGGETSAALLDLLAVGIPAIVSDQGSFAELPDGVVGKVPIDEYETDHLLALFGRLAADADLRRRIGAAALAHVQHENSLDRSVAGYLAVVEGVAADRPTVPVPAPPLSPTSVDDPRLSLMASVGRDLADLGVDEREADTLSGLGDDLVDLGWAPTGEPD